MADNWQEFNAALRENMSVKRLLRLLLVPVCVLVCMCVCVTGERQRRREHVRYVSQHVRRGFDSVILTAHGSKQCKVTFNLSVVREVKQPAEKLTCV